MDPTTMMQSDFIERLRRVHENMLLGYLTEIVGSPDVARQLVKDSFSRVRMSTSEQAAFPRATLFHVATTIAFVHFRRQRMKAMRIDEAMDGEPEVPSHPASQDRGVTADEYSAHLATAIRSLRPILRNIFVMAYVKGTPQDEIAAALGISEKRVQRRLTAALRGCRERLASQGVDMTDVLGFATLIPFAWVLAVH